MTIEVLGFEGCPNTAGFLSSVEAAARQVGGFDILYVDQEKLPINDLRRGYPAPTALLGGHDLFGMPTPEAPSAGCRVYPGGVPTAEQVGTRLRAARQS